MDEAKKKLTVNLSGDIYETLQTLAKEQGTTVTEVLRKAIGTEKFLRQQSKEGAKVLIEDADKNLREVLFR